MSAPKTLPIYRDAGRLVSHLYQSTRKAPRDLRHTLVQSLLGEAVELCVLISQANRTQGQHRAEALDQLKDQVIRVDALFNVATEQRCISVGAAAVAMEYIDSIGKQTFGWSRSVTTTDLSP